jgi:hypothetical protein
MSDFQGPSIAELVDAAVAQLPNVTAAAASFGATGEQMAAASATAWLTAVTAAAPPEVVQGVFAAASLITGLIVMGMTDPEAVGLVDPFDGLV